MRAFSQQTLTTEAFPRDEELAPLLGTKYIQAHPLRFVDDPQHLSVKPPSVNPAIVLAFLVLAAVIGIVLVWSLVEILWFKIFFALLEAVTILIVTFVINHVQRRLDRHIGPYYFTFDKNTGILRTRVQEVPAREVEAIVDLRRYHRVAGAWQQVRQWKALSRDSRGHYLQFPLLTTQVPHTGNVDKMLVRLQQHLGCEVLSVDLNKKASQAHEAEA